MIETVVIIPTYNERGNIERLTNRICRTIPRNMKIIIVDDDSPDGTGELADELATRDARIEVIHRRGERGLGSAYRTGMLRALELGAKRMVTMDADLSHPPERLNGMLCAARNADLVIGSRYTSGGKIENWTAWRRLLSRFANLAARLILGLRPCDATSGFRCYSRELLMASDLEAIRSEGYSFLEEMVFVTQKMGFKIAEIPITFCDRARGESKISRMEILNAVWTVIRLAFLA